jgi:hypothetical protein
MRMRAGGGRRRKIGSQRCRDELVCAIAGENFQSRGANQASPIQLTERLEWVAAQDMENIPTPRAQSSTSWHWRRLSFRFFRGARLTDVYQNAEN